MQKLINEKLITITCQSEIQKTQQKQNNLRKSWYGYIAEFQQLKHIQHYCCSKTLQQNLIATTNIW